MSYTITVKRGQDKGTITFSHGNISVNTTCWWDSNNKIDAGTYTGYASWMSNKREDDGVACPWKNNEKLRPGIYLGRGVPSNNATRTNNGIFIHKGTSAAWSEGCVVCSSSEVLKMWNAIMPKDSACVTIVVEDETAAPEYSPITGPGFGWGCVYNPYHNPFDHFNSRF
jgi:hypothetical protein